MNYQKAYKEALAHAREIHRNEEEKRRDMEFIFPELKESEDERIRKVLIDLVKCNERSGYKLLNNIPTSSMITWLEKQGEQKPKRMISAEAKEAMYNKPDWGEEDEKIVLSIEQIFNCASLLNIVPDKIEKVKSWLKNLKDRVQPQPKQKWSEEDDKMCQETIDWFEKKCFPYALENDNPARESIKWLKSLKDRVLPQPKQEWNEDDETNLTNTIIMLKEGASHNFTYLSIVPCVNWLKSMKERYSWKPSDEQLKVLFKYAEQNNKEGSILTSLYEQLKKLKGE